MLWLSRITGLLLLSACGRASKNPSTQDTQRDHKGLPLCQKSQVEASPREPGHGPWTHAPYCAPTGKPKSQICVFTDANFHLGQGLSVVARPEVAEKLISELLLQRSRYEVPPERVTTKYEAVRGPEQGIGLFVRPSQKYSAGDVIMVDYPTVVLPSETIDSLNLDVLSDLRWRALLQVPEEARARTRDLAQSKGKYVDEIVNIFETNAFTHQKGGVLHDIIFPEAARMNHHCLPNAITRTNRSSFAMEVVALRDIHGGEEINISYLDPSTESSSETRKAALSSGWGFTCQCSICSNKKAPESDRRREQITETKKLIEDSRGQAMQILKHAKTLLELYDQEGMILPKAENYELAAHAAKYSGRNREAREFAGLAKRYWDILFGSESRESGATVEFLRELDAGWR